MRRATEKKAEIYNIKNKKNGQQADAHLQQTSKKKEKKNESEKYASFEDIYMRDGSVEAGNLTH